MKKILVAYFSATGTTRGVAKALAKAVEADLYEIKAATPYTKADLIWTDEKSRSTVEMHDKAFRPAIADKDANVAQYETIFLGFPIWWFVAPTIINTFLESYDFTGKKIILFATSMGSQIRDAGAELKPLVGPSTTLITGKVFRSKATSESLNTWINSLNF